MRLFDPTSTSTVTSTSRFDAGVNKTAAETLAYFNGFTNWTDCLSESTQIMYRDMADENGCERPEREVDNDVRILLNWPLCYCDFVDKACASFLRSLKCYSGVEAQN